MIKPGWDGLLQVGFQVKKQISAKSIVFDQFIEETGKPNHYLAALLLPLINSGVQN